MTGSTASVPSVVAVLSAANFVVGMGAFMVVGLLLPVAADFSLSESEAGGMMTAYAAGYAVLSPVLVSLTGGIGRRRIIAAGVLIFALASLICALASSATLLFAARVFAAAGAGLITPVAASVAAGLSEPSRQASALAAVFFGMTLAQVIGVPAGAWIAFTFGWRAAFAVVVALSIPILWLVWTRVPPGLSFAPVSLRDLQRVMTTPHLMASVLFTALFMTAIYTVYTYLGPLLADQMAYGRNGITATLLIFGLGAVAGNLVGGAVSDRIGPSQTLAGLCVVQIALMPVYSYLPLPDLWVQALSFAWALFGFSFMAAQQVRLIALDPKSAPVLLALNAAAIYVGAAIGSAIGAQVIDSTGLQGLGYAGAVGAVVALVGLSGADRLSARRKRQSPHA